MFVVPLFGIGSLFVYFVWDFGDDPRLTLRVGDCFNVAESKQASDLSERNCDETHNAEVILRFESTRLGTSNALAQCNREVADVLDGLPTAPPADAVTVGAFYPNEEKWNDGDRLIICYIRSEGGIEGRVSAE